MKYKCPYCKKVSEADKAPSVCPSCKKTMTIPDNLREKKFRDRKKDRDKILNAADRERQRIFTPDHKFNRKPSTVFILLGVLAIAGAIVVYKSGSPDKPSSEFHRIQRAEKELTALRVALDRFKKDCGRYPREDEGLDSLIFDPNIKGWGGKNRWRYISKIKPDQWRVPYQYRIVSNEVSVFSFGPDRTPGTEDDLYGTLPDTNALPQKVVSTNVTEQTAPAFIPVNIKEPTGN